MPKTICCFRWLFFAVLLLLCWLFFRCYCLAIVVKTRGFLRPRAGLAAVFSGIISDGEAERIRLQFLAAAAAIGLMLQVA
jgi:hypothetical protein